MNRGMRCNLTNDGSGVIEAIGGILLPSKQEPEELLSRMKESWGLANDWNEAMQEAKELRHRLAMTVSRARKLLCHLRIKDKENYVARAVEIVDSIRNYRQVQ